jgi:CheY-like chemotaxis protein
VQISIRDGARAAHVLLLEDDADTREVLRIILESEGMIVCVAAEASRSR